MDTADTLIDGDTTQIKELTQLTLRDENTRALWSGSSLVWDAVLKRLQTEIEQTSGGEKQVLQLANNLSATLVAGASISSEFLLCFAELEFTNIEERRLQWQVLANFSSGMGDTLSKMGTKILLKLVSNQSRTLSDLDTQSFAVPYLLFFKNVSEAASAADLATIARNSKALELILSKLPDWHSAEKGTLVLLSAHIVSAYTEHGIVPELVHAYSQDLSNLLTLFETIELLLNSPLSEFAYLQDPAFWATDAGYQVASAMKHELQTGIAPLVSLIMSKDRSQQKSLMLWSTVRMLLDILAIVTPLLSDQALNEYRQDLLHELIALLKATKELPSKSKLADAGQEYIPDPSDFPYLRSGVIPVLSVVTKSNKSSQDEMRISGGLNVILESCVIDANNPFMKERAIVCIRYLLENNLENQDFVAAMEAKQVVDGQTLEKAGYETEIRDGKITLKRSAS